MTPRSDLTRARLLLRLYPRAWRERYGEEFVSLIEETGLTWRTVLNVVVSALIQRMHSLVAWRRQEPDPEKSITVFASLTARELLTELSLFAALIVATVLAVGQVGVSAPQWLWWLQVLPYYFAVRSDFVRLNTTSLRRVGIGYYFFLEAIILCGAAWLVGRGIVSTGVSEQAQNAWLAFAVVVFLVVAVRVGYWGFRFSPNKGNWPGFHRIELRVLKGASLTILVAAGLTDPSGSVMWGMAGMVFICRPVMARLSRPAVASRRAAIARLKAARTS